MTLENLIRQQADLYTARAVQDKQLAEASDDLANRIRYAVRSTTYSIVVDGLLTALRDAEDVEHV